MKANQDIHEKELLEKLRDGDERAFNALYHQHKKRLVRNFVRVLRSEELANDAMQDLFLKIWEHRLTLDPEQPFQGFLVRLAKNIVIDYYRRGAREEKMQTHFLNTAEEAYSHIEELIISREHIAQVQKIINELPEQQKKCFSLHKLDGKSYKEISDMLGISTSTIGTHILQANQYVRKQIQDHPELFVYLWLSTIFYMP